MKWGELPADAELGSIICPIVEPIIPPAVAPLISAHNHDDVYSPINHAHVPEPHNHDSLYVPLSDSRLSDARTPIPHSHSQSEVMGLIAALSAKENVLGNPSTDGQILSSTAAGVRSWMAPSGSGGLWQRVALSADRTNNNAVANTLQDVTGLSFPVVAGQRYWFKFRIIYTAQATTTGSRWSINGPATTGLSYMSEYSLTATTTTRNATLTAFNLPAASNATSATTGLGNYAEIEGFIQPSANGNVVARFASEVANSAIIAKAGSFVEYTST